MKKKISYLLIFTMLLSTVFGSGLTMTAFAETTDSFSWAFWNSQQTPEVKNIEAETQNVVGTGTKYLKFSGEQRDFAPDNYGFGNGITGGSGDQSDAESKKRILESSTTSKWLSPSGPHWVSFEMAEAITPKHYYITSANDSPDRDPASWVLEGSDSKDGPWTEIDKQTGQGAKFAEGRFQSIIYTIPELSRKPYKHYRLNNIVRSGGGNGMMQFSRICFFEDFEEIGFDGETDYLYPQIAAGPAAIWDAPASSWNGENVLIVNGKSAASGSETINAKSYTTILDGLNIKVHSDTNLSYMISPEGITTNAYSNEYDYKYTSHHMAIDLKFADGSRLKDLGATDQYGYGLNPLDQGRSKVLGTCMWNYVLSDLGKVAAGKTITEIIVGFEMPDCTPDTKAKAVFDDIKIYRETIDLEAIELADFVDIRQGTNVSGYAAGALMPMAAMPNPFNMWAPATNRTGASKYNYVNSGLKGIAISHVASRHMGERGSFSFMSDSTTVPTGTTAQINTAVTNAVNNSNGLFKHENEIAHNYHYSVTFNEDDDLNPGVTMEITPTVHAAVLRFTFPAGSKARNIILDSPDSNGNVNRSNMARIGTTNAFNAWKQDGSDTSGGSTGMKRMHIYGEFSETPSSFNVPDSGYARTMVSFDDLANGPDGSTVVELKVASSFMNAEQAEHNLNLEVDAADSFDDVCIKAKAEWNDVLSAVVIEDEDTNYSRLSDFYSKLARTHLYPTILTENTGTNEAPVWQYTTPYSGTNANPIIKDGHFIYNEGWWDTYRSKWTLQAFLRPNASSALMDGTVQHFIDNDSEGRFAIPRWINPGGSNMMVGTSSDVIITDLYARGIDFNYEDGYLSAIKSSSVYSTESSQGGRNGMQESIFKGYTPYGSAAPAGGGGQLDTSWALEGYLNDGGLAKMAMQMRDEYEDTSSPEWIKLNDEYLYFQNRSKYFVNIFNPANGGWFRNKSRTGAWQQTDDEFNPHSWGNGYCEDNAFPYSVLAPQDGQGLANLYGGKEAFGLKMDDIFTNNGDYTGGGYGGWIHEAIEKREVKMGQVAVSNQTSYHLPYMYLHTDKPWNTQKYIRELVQRTFSGEAIGRGYLGEEDNGAYSSWYVLSALGIYPLDMGSGQFVIGSPIFKKTTITTDAGDVYTINAPNNSHENVYIQSMTIDGEEWNKLYIDNSQFHDGMQIELVMSPIPTAWGTAEDSAPPSLTQGDGIENTPDILMDITYKGVPIVETIPASDRETDAAYVTNMTAANAAYLFDDASANSSGNATADAQFSTSDESAITYYVANGSKVEMYTITSSSTTSNADPKEWTLSGSNNGTSWTVLDTRTDETFQWRRYTRPFAIASELQGHYKYYKLNITEASSANNLRLAQFELLADQYASVDKADLLDKINQAKAIDSTLYGPIEYKTLLDEIVIAEKVYGKTDATGKELLEAINELQNAIDKLVMIRKAYVPFNATEYDSASAGISVESTTTAEGSDIPVGIAIPNIGGTKPGNILAYDYIDFGNGEKAYTRARATYAGNTTDCNNSHVIVRLDSPDGPVIADINMPPTAGGVAWNVYKYGYGEMTEPVSGLHTVYFELLNDGNHVANIYQFVFETAEDVTPSDWIVNQFVSEENNEITVNANVRNNTDTEESVSVCVAAYTADGKLVGSNIKTIDVPNKAWVSIDSILLDVSAAGEGYYIKTFCWSASDFRPLVDATTR